ncbi:MAG: SCO1/SenC [Verrucomicrobia bacterium]|jgi:protein SCO1/2|nr:SCO1/SenC [Verrucomicrobiota bacterium]
MKTLLTTCLGLVVCLVLSGCRTTPTPPCCRELKAGRPYTDSSLYQLDSLWLSDAEKEIRLGVLRGRPQVVAMFFTRCEYACPIIVNDLKRIDATLPEKIRQQTDFLLVSFDPVNDRPEALRAYRQRQKLPLERWTLVSGKSDDVRELAALLGVNYRLDARGQFAHSNLITLLNAEGEIIAQQQGLNQSPEEMVRKIEQLFSKP